jgi:hypothetical protein
LTARKYHQYICNIGRRHCRHRHIFRLYGSRSVDRRHSLLRFFSVTFSSAERHHNVTLSVTMFTVLLLAPTYFAADAIFIIDMSTGFSGDGDKGDDLRRR